MTVYNTKDFGAFGDGKPHPLSDRFPNLTEAQKYYPAATSLAESIEWHAHDRAIAAAKASVGGVIYTPAGTYIMSPAPRELRFPMYDNRSPSPVPTTVNCRVDWVGDGRALSILKWTADYATPGAYGSTYAVMCGEQSGSRSTSGSTDNRYSSNVASAHSFGVFRDIHLEGPSTTLLPANTIGSQGCYMSGICWAAARRVDQIGVSGFYAGVDIVGDHTDLNFFIRNCYYGLYLNVPSVTLYGDLTVSRKAVVEACRMACVGFNYAAVMATWHWTGRPFLGTSPYVFFKEATPSGTTTPPPVKNFLSGCLFDALFMESVGNAYFWDDNLVVNGAPSSSIEGCKFINLTFSGYNSALLISGRDRCIMQVGQIIGSSFENVTLWPQAASIVPPTGTLRPLFDFTDTVSNIIGEFLISGDIEALISLANGASVPPVRFATAGSDGREGRNIKLHHYRDATGSWRGAFYVVANGQTVNQTDLVALGGGFARVRQAVSTLTSGGFIGVARMTATGTSGQVVVAVAEEGVTVPVGNNGTFTAGSLIKISSTPGKATNATGTGDTKVIGYAGAGTALTFRANGTV